MTSQHSLQNSGPVSTNLVGSDEIDEPADDESTGLRSSSKIVHVLDQYEDGMSQKDIWRVEIQRAAEAVCTRVEVPEPELEDDDIFALLQKLSKSATSVLSGSEDVKGRSKKRSKQHDDMELDEEAAYTEGEGNNYKDLMRMSEPFIRPDVDTRQVDRSEWQWESSDMEDYLFPRPTTKEALRDLFLEEEDNALYDLCQEFLLSREDMLKAKYVIQREIKKGLKSRTHTSRCTPTCVRRLPTGHEKGKIVVLDLGLTDFRVMLADLAPAWASTSGSSTSSGQQTAVYKSNVICLPDEVVPIVAIEPIVTEKSLEFVLESVTGFLREHGLNREDEEAGVPMGLVCDFPVARGPQVVAYMDDWSKGLCEYTEAVGMDVVRMVRQGMAQRGFNGVNLMLVTTETAGCLGLGAMERLDCRIGITLGASAHAAYMAPDAQKLLASFKMKRRRDIHTDRFHFIPDFTFHQPGMSRERIKENTDGEDMALPFDVMKDTMVAYVRTLIEQDRKEDPKEPPIQAGTESILVEVDWGTLADNGCLDFIRTDLDAQVDKESINRDTYLFEKLVCKQPMAEMCRLLMVRLMDRGWLFRDVVGVDPGWEVLRQPGAFPSHYAVDCECEHEGRTSRCRDLMSRINPTGQRLTDRDCFTIRKICQVVTRRAASIVASGIVALTQLADYQTAPEPLPVAINGSLFRFHPFFRRILLEELAVILPERQVELIMVDDPGGVGVVMLTAAEAAAREEEKSAQQPATS